MRHANDALHDEDDKNSELPLLIDVDAAVNDVLIGYSRVPLERLNSPQIMFGGEWPDNSGRRRALSTHTSGSSTSN
jgi:hypothetical protein